MYKLCLQIMIIEKSDVISPISMKTSSSNPLLYPVVLVCLGFYDRLPQIGWFINNGYLFLEVLGVGSPKSECGMVWFSPESLSRFQSMEFSLFPQGRRASEGSLQGLFYSYLSPIHESPISGLNHLLKTHFLMPSTWALEFQQLNLGEHKHSHHTIQILTF